MIKKAVVLCGGMATRFLPISKSVPKEMLPILNTPVIGRIVNELKDAGITDCLIIIGRNKESLVNYFDRNVELEHRLLATKRFEFLKLEQTHENINIAFKRQINAKGTGHGVNLAKSFVGNDPFILMFGDEVVFGKTTYAQQLINQFNKSVCNVVATKVINKKECNKYGMIKFNSNHKFVEIIEKPDLLKCPSDVCYIGGCVLNPTIFNCLSKITKHTNKTLKIKKYFKLTTSNFLFYVVGKKKIVEISITDAINALAKIEKVDVVNISGVRFDVGNAVGFVEANIYAGLHSEHGSEIKNFIQKEINHLI